MSGGAKTVKYGAAHLRPYSSPWAVWLALPFVGILFHTFAAISTPASVVVGAVGGIGGAILVGFTWHVFQPRAHSIRVHATVTVAGAAVWTMWVTAVGLFQWSPWRGWNVLEWLLGWFVGWPWGAWALIGPIACLTWNLRRVSRGEGNDTHADAGGGLMEAIGIAGRVKRVELEAGDTRVRAKVGVQRGTHTAADIQQAAGSIASAVGIRRGGVRVVSNPDDFSQADILITPRDLLADTLVWQGPSAPGGSIIDAIPAGRYEDGETAQLWFPGDEKKQRNATHFALSGMSGAGKTESGLSVLTDGLTRRDFAVVFSDHVKGVQSVTPIAAGIGLVLTEQLQAVAAMRQLDKVISARTNQLGKYGFSQWTPQAALPVDKGGAGLKLTVYWIEESAALIADSAKFVQATERARSAGLILVISQQRLSHDRIETSARSNIGANWCFGVRTPDEAKFALSEETLDAGACPWEWKSAKPGYSYLEAPGIDPSRWAMPLRGWLPDKDHLREVIAEFCLDPTLDATTAEAFGKVYTDYRRQVDEGATAWQQVAPKGRTLIAVPDMSNIEDEDDEELDVDGEDDTDDDVDLEIPEQPEPGFMDDIDIEQEIPGDDLPLIPLGPVSTGEGMGTVEAREALRSFLEQLGEQGHETVKPEQLVEFRRHVGRSASWLTKELKRLVREGVLEDAPDRGVYGLRSAALVSA